MDAKSKIASYKISANSLPEARNRTWWATPLALVQVPFRVTMTNIKRWAWKGVQQTKKTKTTATEKESKPGVINDPHGKAHNHTENEHYFHSNFVLFP